MSDEVRVELILLWHQHQPDYRDPTTGRARLPWVRLHATKDYLDMARRLAPWPRVKVTFNFVPSLIDQLEAAVAGAGDELFDRLERDPRELPEPERTSLAQRLTQVPAHARSRRNAWTALIERAARGEASEPDALLALEVGFLLAWLDPSFHASPEAAAARAGSPTLALRDGLLALHRRLLADVVPAHRDLRAQGRIELSTSPYYHPILPLLIDVASAARARPDLPLPRERFAAPEDARAQIARALERHAEVFGERPRGLWPSEGSVSPETAALAASLGLSWLATDQGVLERSLEGSPPAGAHHRPWRYETPAGPLHLFFRDHELSDRIGFVYQRWRAEDAVGDFIERLRRIGREHDDAPPVVSVMLDGENCWEGYEEDGGPFLDRLYAALDRATDIRTTTPAEVLEPGDVWPSLSRLHSGSWIDADFHVWAGHPEKNHAWDLLSRARARLAAHAGAPEAAWESLRRAEGSDWFWWLGEDHYTADKALFDSLFRGHLRAVYESCGEPIPLDLEVPISATVRPDRAELPVALLTPVLDGRVTHFYEWQPAGHRSLAGGGAMHAQSRAIRDLYYGFDRDRFYLRIDFVAPPGPNLGLRIEWLEPVPTRLELPVLAPGPSGIDRVLADGRKESVSGAAAHLDAVLEIALPLVALATRPRDRVSFMVQLIEAGRPIESAPAGDAVRLEAPDESFDADAWAP